MGYSVECPKGDFKKIERYEFKARKKAVQHSKKTGHMDIRIIHYQKMYVPTKRELENRRPKIW